MTGKLILIEEAYRRYGELKYDHGKGVTTFKSIIDENGERWEPQYNFFLAPTGYKNLGPFK